MHFPVLVVGRQVGQQLALYDRDTRLTPYRRYVTEEEIAEEREFLDGAIDTKEVVRLLAGEDLSPNDDVGRDERGWYFWSTQNWMGRWDYWVLDERYALLTKPGGAVVRLDQTGFEWPDLLDRPDAWQRAAPGERWRGVQSTVGEIDFAAMDREAREAAGDAWDSYDVARRNGQIDELQLRQIAGFTREEFLLRHRWHPGYLVEGGRLHERGDHGLRADISDERAAEWARFVDQFIASLPTDTLLTKVNCHS